MEFASSRAEFGTVKAQLMKQGHLEDMKELSVRQQILELNSARNRLQKELKELLNKQLPELYREHSKLYTSQILLSDYEFKIKRQLEETKRLEETAKFLLAQNARQKMLPLFFMAEMETHNQINKILADTVEMFENEHQEIISRKVLFCVDSILPSKLFYYKKKLYSELKSQKSDQSQFIQQLLQTNRLNAKASSSSEDWIDPQESFMQSIFHILTKTGKNESSFETPPQDRTFVSNEEFQQAVSKFKSTLELVQKKKSQSKKQRQIDLSKIEDSIQTLEGILYSSSDTAKPVLSSPSLLTAQQSVCDKLESVTKTMDALLKQRNSYLHMLNNDKELAAERMLFVEFFKNPQHFLQYIEKKEKRSNANQIHL